MPVYNGATYISEAIDCVLAQTMPGLQLIVVDDGSTDGTRAMVTGYGDRRVELVEQANRGPSAARNAGLSMCRGEYVAFLDADDWWSTEFLEEMIGALESTSNRAGFAHCGWTHAEAAQKRLGPLYLPSAPATASDLAISNPFPIHACLTTRELVLAAGGFDESMRALEDWDLWLRVFLLGAHSVRVPRLMAYYRIVPNSNSSSYTRMREHRVLLLEKLYSRTDLPQAVRALRSSAYAAAYLQSAADRVAGGDSGTALQDLRQAIRCHPLLLQEEQLYYALAAAAQPDWRLGGVASADPHRAEVGLGLLHRAIVEEGDSLPPGALEVAKARGLLVTGQLAYGSNRLPEARNALAGAFRGKLPIRLKARALVLLAKSLLGRGLLGACRSSTKRLRSLVSVVPGRTG